MSSTVSKQTRITTRQLTMTALFVALIAVGASYGYHYLTVRLHCRSYLPPLAGIVLGSRLALLA